MVKLCIYYRKGYRVMNKEHVFPSLPWRVSLRYGGRYLFLVLYQKQMLVYTCSQGVLFWIPWIALIDPATLWDSRLTLHSIWVLHFIYSDPGARCWSGFKKRWNISRDAQKRVRGLCINPSSPCASFPAQLSISQNLFFRAGPFSSVKYPTVSRFTLRRERMRAGPLDQIQKNLNICFLMKWNPILFSRFILNSTSFNFQVFIFQRRWTSSAQCLPHRSIYTPERINLLGIYHLC